MSQIRSGQEVRRTQIKSICNAYSGAKTITPHYCAIMWRPFNVSVHASNCASTRSRPQDHRPLERMGRNSSFASAGNRRRPIVGPISLRNLCSAPDELFVNCHQAGARAPFLQQTGPICAGAIRPPTKDVASKSKLIIREPRSWARDSSQK